MPGPEISAVVEGSLDEAVVRRMIHHVGGIPGPFYGKNGKGSILKRLSAWNGAARFHPWIVVVDLDDDDDCAAPARKGWLPRPAPFMCFRIAVREIESWILADRYRAARFLCVPVARVPSDPESLPDPKRTVVQLALVSTSTQVFEDIVPWPGSGRRTGPAYNARLIEFVQGRWRPHVAARSSESLRRAIACLRSLVARSGGTQDPARY